MTLLLMGGSIGAPLPPAAGGATAPASCPIPHNFSARPNLRARIPPPGPLVARIRRGHLRHPDPGNHGRNRRNPPPHRHRNLQPEARYQLASLRVGAGPGGRDRASRAGRQGARASLSPASKRPPCSKPGPRAGQGGNSLVWCPQDLYPQNCRNTARKERWQSCRLLHGSRLGYPSKMII